MWQDGYAIAQQYAKEQATRLPRVDLVAWLQKVHNAYQGLGKEWQEGWQAGVEDYLVSFEFKGYYLVASCDWGANKVVAVRKVHNLTLPTPQYETVSTLFLTGRHSFTFGDYVESFQGCEMESTLAEWQPISRELALEMEPKLVEMVDNNNWRHAQRVS